MLTEYKSNIAEHYFAYRPPLHKLILEISLKSQKFKKGLDVGCGTGNSSIALKHFCSRVTGIDPSIHMINRAISYKGVEYVNSDLFDLPVKENTYDIVTFAGSLFYIKSQELLDKILIITKEKGVVVIYDFKIHLNEICSKLFGKSFEKKIQYNHRVSFTGLDKKTLLFISSKSQRLSFDIKADELTHLILSSQKWYRAAQSKYNADDPFRALKNEMRKKPNYILTAEIYFSLYENTSSLSNE